jgi:hypothetical protein
MKSKSNWTRLVTLVAIVLAPTGVACSLILDKNKDQCTQNGDCARFGAGYSCNAGLCATRSGVLPDGATDPDGAAPDGGCIPKTPKSSTEEFLNEPCTGSTCIPFDNCARLGLCDGGRLPALVDPPDGGV